MAQIGPFDRPPTGLVSETDRRDCGEERKERRAKRSPKEGSEKNEARGSLTGSQARRMRYADGAVRPAYNAQIAVASDHGLVAAIRATADTTAVLRRRWSRKLSAVSAGRSNVCWRTPGSPCGPRPRRSPRETQEVLVRSSLSSTPLVSVMLTSSFAGTRIEERSADRLGDAQAARYDLPQCDEATIRPQMGGIANGYERAWPLPVTGRIGAALGTVSGDSGEDTLASAATPDYYANSTASPRRRSARYTAAAGEQKRIVPCHLVAQRQARHHFAWQGRAGLSSVLARMTTHQWRYGELSCFRRFHHSH